jgi:hypothetical protein
MDMRSSFAAPRTIRRIAARRVFHSPSGKDVVLTLGVPQPVPGSDWGCAVQITGLTASWARPRYVFGIDGLQALQLAMKCAGLMLQSSRVTLSFLGQSEDLMMPRFFPDVLPPRVQDRVDAFAERQVEKFVAAAERRHRRRARASRRRPPRSG